MWEITKGPCFPQLSVSSPVDVQKRAPVLLRKRKTQINYEGGGSKMTEVN